MTITTIKDIEKYPNEWVAIDEKQHKVVGHGKTFREAALDAKSKGYEKVVFMLVPDPTSHYVKYAVWSILEQILTVSLFQLLERSEFRLKIVSQNPPWE